jgi:hypothetical protein
VLLERTGLLGRIGPYRTKTKDDFASFVAGHLSPVTRHFHRSVHCPDAVLIRIQAACNESLKPFLLLHYFFVYDADRFVVVYRFYIFFILDLLNVYILYSCAYPCMPLLN